MKRELVVLATSVVLSTTISVLLLGWAIAVTRSTQHSEVSDLQAQDEHILKVGQFASSLQPLKGAVNVMFMFQLVSSMEKTTRNMQKSLGNL